MIHNELLDNNSFLKGIVHFVLYFCALIQSLKVVKVDILYLLKTLRNVVLKINLKIVRVCLYFIYNKIIIATGLF